MVALIALISEKTISDINLEFYHTKFLPALNMVEKHLNTNGTNVCTNCTNK